MKYFIILLSIFAVTVGYAQEKELQLLLSDINSNPVEIPSTFSETSLKHVRPSVLSEEHVVEKALICECYAVSIVFQGGYTFHVADYYDGTRVVTCLDGYLVGLQCVSVNGIIIIESTDVKWYKDYFTHKYPAGRIDSYGYTQFITIY